MFSQQIQATEVLKIKFIVTGKVIGHITTNVKFTRRFLYSPHEQSAESMAVTNRFI